MLGRSLLRTVAAPAARSVQGQSVRQFAAAAAEEKVQLPIQLYGLPARYANALYVASVKKKVLPTVEKDLAAITGLVAEMPTFKSYLENPVISRRDKVEDMEKIGTKMGMNEITRSFLCVLAENGRLNEVEKIAESFTSLLNAERGLVEAKVVSAQPLNGAQQKQLEGVLKTLSTEGQKLKIQHEVDADLIGGLQVQIGDRFIDLSIQSKINKMWKSLRENKQ